MHHITWVALVIALIIPLLIFEYLSLVHCARNPQLNNFSKVAWGCLILFTNLVGASLYGIVVVRKPFYRNMGICGMVFMIVVLVIASRIKRNQEHQLAELAIREHSMKQQSIATQLQIYKLNYISMGLPELSALLESGRCDELRQACLVNGDRYITSARAKGFKNDATTRQLFSSSQQLCESVNKKTP